MKNISKLLKYSVFCLSITVILITNVIIWHGSKSFLVDEIKIEMNQKVNLAKKIIDLNAFTEYDYSSLKIFTNEIKRLTGLRTTLISKTGTVLADSEIDIQKLGSVENHFGRPEIQDAFSSGSGFAIRRSTTINKDLMYYCENLYSEKRVVGFIRFAMFSTNFDEQMGNITNLLVISDLIFLISVFIFFLYYNNKMRSQIETLHIELENSRNGNFFTGISPQEFAEFDFLSSSINLLGSKLQNNISVLSERNNELLGVFNSLEVSVAAFNSNGKILYYNSAFVDLTNNPQSAVSGEYFYNFIDFPPLINDIQDYIKNKITIKKLCKYFRDTYIEYQISPLILSNLEDNGFLITITDVTNIQKTEIMRQDFVSNVSHEFKTPLTSIRGYAETLLSSKPNNPEVQEKFLQKIAKQTYQLESIVNDLLQLSRVEKNENIVLQQMNPFQIFEDISTDFQIQCSTKNLFFKTEFQNQGKELLINANANLLQMLLTNLLVNAIQYCRENGKIWFRVKEADNELVIEIEDTGVGIPEKEIQRIFERFYRVENTRNINPEGTGLGLSIVKHIVELLKGKIELESRLNEGSVFRIFLPISG
ncbi:MAG: GHKL domain-containing protein [Bacteroidetes bacterium]|nr:GHKL domain-containing protein [Bacteroidota bacterium]